MSSLEKRTNANGTTSWRVRFPYQGHNQAKTFVTESAAKSWRGVLDEHGPARALKLLQEPRRTSGRTVIEQLEHHVEHLTGIQDGTRYRYDRMIQTYRPYFGGMLLVDLTREECARWVNSMTGAAKTVRNHHALLSAGLSSAVRDGLIPGNPGQGDAPSPRPARRRARLPDPRAIRAPGARDPDHASPARALPRRHRRTLR